MAGPEARQATSDRRSPSKTRHDAVVLREAAVHGKVVKGIIA
jgi:hypothetical protein